jgi:hypothetical protein
MNRTTHTHTTRQRLNHILEHSRHWFQRLEPHLDRLEEFASNLGGSYVRRLDGALLAMAGGIGALLLIAMAP